MNTTGAGPGSARSGVQAARAAIRQTLWITALAVLGYISIRNLPVDGGALHYTDFAAADGALEFCEPGGPQFVPVDRVRSPVTMEVRPSGAGEPLRAGATTRLVVALTASSGRPVTSDDLLVVHTRKLHLLAIDPSLDDYQHLHPEATGVPGQFAVEFTPRRAGEYRLFADFTPRATGRALYAGARLAVAADDGEPGLSTEPVSSPSAVAARPESSPDLVAPAGDGARGGGRSAGSVLSDLGRPLSSEPPASDQAAAIDETRESVVEGYRFVLSLDREPARINGTAELRLDVRAPDGSRAQLEEIMGAHAHVVAFDRGRTGFAHLHPLAAPAAAGADAAESLRFQLSLSDPGTYRLWAQVKIDGRELFAPFTVAVQP